MPDQEFQRGHLVAQALAGAWRESTPGEFVFTESQLDEVTPLLSDSGAGALGWWRIRNSDLRSTASAEVLHQAYRLQVLQAAVREEKVKKIFALLRSASVEPLLVKGWSAALLYPEQALRPYGDIDLCVRSEDVGVARSVLSSPESSDCWVDLHNGFTELQGRSVDQLFERSKLVALDSEPIRILAAEDHLALLAIHFLKHGGWRPLWLCDISAVIEGLPARFDWDICLGRDRTRARWIISAIGLAHRLLLARLDLLPFATEVRELPLWLVATVLRHWEAPFVLNQPPMSHSAPMRSYFRNPTGVFKGLRERWPDPILATVSVRGEFNNLPRLPYQVANCLMRMSRLMKQA